MLEALGEGGLSQVFRARRDQDGADVALKVLRADVIDHARSREALAYEARLLQRLPPHPGLPRVFAAGDAPVPWLALERLQGLSVAESVQMVGPLTSAEVEQLATRLLRVLNHLHTHGVLHRDVKPGNVVLGYDQRVVLFDLGTAIELGGEAAAPVEGTLAYMPPEQLEGMGTDPRTDLYALGVTLYFALTGKLPYQARDVSGYREAHRAQRAEDLVTLAPEASPQLLRLIQRLMHRDPARRPTSATEALALLAHSKDLWTRLNRPPLVGRAGALAAVEGCLDADRALVLVGPPGSGTARLLEAVRRLVRERGGEVIGVRCREDEDAASFLERVPPAPAGPSAPTLIVEELQRCTPDVLAALDAQPGGVIGVATWLPDVPSGWYAHRLRPLSEDDTQDLLLHMLDAEQLPAGLLEVVHPFSGGLCAIAVRVVRSLVQRGRLYPEEGPDGSGEWRFERAGRLVLDGDVRRRLHGVLEQATDADRALLGVLACADAALDAPTIRLAAGLPADQALPEQPDVTSLLVREPAGWRLNSGALVELVLESLPSDHARRIHLRLARHLAHNERRSWHQALALEPVMARSALIELATRRLDAGQVEAALEALDALPHTAFDDTLGVWKVPILRGRLLDRLGRTREATSAWTEAAKLAHGNGDARGQGEALLRLAGTALAEGDRPRLARLLEQAKGLGEDAWLGAWAAAIEGERQELAGDLYLAMERLRLAQSDAATLPALAARVHGAMGRVSHQLGDLDGARRWLDLELTYARLRPRGRVLGAVAGNLAHVLGRLGELEQAVALIDEADAQEHAAHPDADIELAVARARCLLLTGQRSRARRWLTVKCQAPGRDTDCRTHARFRAAMATLLRRDGDHQAALVAHQRAEEQAQRSGQQGRVAVHRAYQVLISRQPERLRVELDELAPQQPMAHAELAVEALETFGLPFLERAEAAVAQIPDVWLLLRVLHAKGDAEARQLAGAAVQVLLAPELGSLRRAVMQLPSVRWALAT